MSFSRPRVRRKPPQPTVSASPLQANMSIPMGRGAAAPDPGRVICLFGPPGSGVTTILRILTEAASARTALLKPDFGVLRDQVRGIVAEAVFVDGFPKCGKKPNLEPSGPDEIQYLYDNRIVYPGSGAVVRVNVDPELLIRSGRATSGGIEAWFAGLPALESHIRVLNLPYFSIHNEPGEEGLTQAVADLARRSSVLR